MAGELVSAYIRLIPTVEGIQGATAKALAPAVGTAGVVGKQAGSRFGSAFGLSAKKLLVAGGGLLAGLGLAKFLGSSAEAFKELNAEVKGLQRTAGGSIAEVSELRGALQLSGVTVPKATISLKIFSKQLGMASKDAKKSAAMQKLLGSSFQDSSGNVENLTTLLPRVADTFKQMKDGPNKAALALKLFGRSGIDMLPFLNKGSAGIKELEAQAKKLGITLDDAAQEKWKKYREESRRADAAMQGLKVTIGGAVLPLFTKFSTVITDRVAPAFAKVNKFIKTNPIVQGVLKTIGDGFAAIGTTIDKVKDKLGGIDFSKLGDIDGKKLGKQLGDAIIGAVDFALTKLGVVKDKVVRALGKIDWVGIGVEAGPFVAQVSIGIGAGLVNALVSEKTWSGIWRHKGDILGAIALAVGFVFAAPEALTLKIAGMVEKIPFAGAVASGLVRSISRAGGRFFRGPLLSLGRTIAKGFGEVINALKPPSFARWFSRIGAGLRQNFGRAIDDMWAWVELRFEAGFSGLARKISGLGNRLWGSLGKIGASIGNGLVNGLTNAWGTVTAGIRRLILRIPAVVRQLLGIKSPSRVFMEIGGFVGEGLAQGIDGSHKRVREAVTGLAATGSPTATFSTTGRFAKPAAPAPAAAGGLNRGDLDYLARRLAALMGISQNAAIDDQLAFAGGLGRAGM
jgi:hypothetical protein